MSLFNRSYNKFVGNLYYMTRSSLIAALKECIDDMKRRNLSKEITFVDLDCHAEIQELPQVDFVGIKSFSMYDDDGVCQVSTFVCCSTMNDENAIRLSKIISYVFSRFAGNISVNILNENQQVITTLDIKSGVEVMPMSKSDGRMVQYIDITGNISTAIR